MKINEMLSQDLRVKGKLLKGDEMVIYIYVILMSD